MNLKQSPRDPQKDFAAQSAQEGVVNVSDLSLLTGIAVAQLTKFAKLGQIEHYGEYHGKRFFNFQALVKWAVGPGRENEAGIVIRKALETQTRSADCPYSIEKVRSGSDDVRVCWKITPATPAAQAA